MTGEEFRAIVNGYNGEITEDENTIKISAKNRLITHYQSGEVFADRIVPCYIAFDKNCDTLQGEEATFSIIGGFSWCSPIKKETVIEQLERYGFKKKQIQQLSFL